MLSFLRIRLLRLKYKGCSINTPSIHPSAQFGEKVQISSGCIIGRHVKIGSQSYINTYSIVSSGEIGKFCSIASFCSIGQNNHPIDWISSSPFLYDLIGMNGELGYIEKKEVPKIGNDVWIGAHSIILKGVTIGDGAVIAAGSVVNKDVPAYSIVGGIPAKVLKYRFEPNVIEKLLELKWWNKSNSEIKGMKDFIFLKENFVAKL